MVSVGVQEKVSLPKEEWDLIKHHMFLLYPYTRCVNEASWLLPEVI